MKKLFIFDLDNTLTESRMPIGVDTAKLLCELLSRAEVAGISGESFEEFDKQLISRLSCKEKFEKLFILPTSGGELWDCKDGKWRRIHSELMSQEIREKLSTAIMEMAGISADRARDFIEDRGGQITYSALGIAAPIEKKKYYDPDGEKRRDFVDKIAPLFPNLSFRIGGMTSVDATMKGVDKAFGIKKLLEYRNISAKDAIFVGDSLFAGGNDNAAKETAVDIIETSGPEETKKIIAEFLKNEK